MTAVLNIVFAVVAGMAILTALYFGGRAVLRRSQPGQSSYNVERQQARKAIQVDLIRALAAILVALIFLGAFGLTPRPAESLISPTEPAILEAPASPTPPATLVPEESTDLPTPEAATPTVELIIEEPTPSPLPASPLPAEPTDPPQPAVQTAVVSSGVGVWLRAEPSTTGEQLEWLLDGTILALLDGQETADDLLWQQVQTETGLLGWVAADFILISE